MPLCSCLHSYGVYQSGRIWVFFELLQGQAFSPLHHGLLLSPLYCTLSLIASLMGSAYVQESLD